MNRSKMNVDLKENMKPVSFSTQGSGVNNEVVTASSLNDTNCNSIESGVDTLLDMLEKEIPTNASLPHSDLSKTLETFYEYKQLNAQMRQLKELTTHFAFDEKPEIGSNDFQPNNGHLIQNILVEHAYNKTSPPKNGLKFPLKCTDLICITEEEWVSFIILFVHLKVTVKRMLLSNNNNNDPPHYVEDVKLFQHRILNILTFSEKYTKFAFPKTDSAKLLLLDILRKSVFFENCSDLLKDIVMDMCLPEFEEESNNIQAIQEDIALGWDYFYENIMDTCDNIDSK